MKSKKRTKKFFCYLCVVLAGLTCFILFSGSSSSCYGTVYTYEEALEGNWGVVLPENRKELFRKSESTFGRFGTKYAVFELEEEPTEFIADFSEEKDSKFEYHVSFFLGKARIDIPEEYLPDWDEEYCWKQLNKEYKYSETDIVIDKCYIMYFNNLKRLSICQYFV